MDPATVVSIISALGIGSFVGQYLIGSRERRQLRSDVLTQLSYAETARWAGHSKPPTPDFNTSIRDLETAALIARVPRKAVMHYKRLAYTGWWLSVDDAESNPDHEFAGGIDGDLANLIRAAAAEVSHVVWSPWLGRMRLSRRLQKQDQTVRTIDSGGVKHTYARAGEHLGHV